MWAIWREQAEMPPLYGRFWTVPNQSRNAIISEAQDRPWRQASCRPRSTDTQRRTPRSSFRGRQSMYAGTSNTKPTRILRRQRARRAMSRTSFACRRWPSSYDAIGGERARRREGQTTSSRPVLLEHASPPAGRATEGRRQPPPAFAAIWTRHRDSNL
jgi:hypothetical protein